MFETLFHEYGLITVLRSCVTRQGPSSWNNPIRESEPGPPLSQIDSGSSAGFLDVFCLLWEVRSLRMFPFWVNMVEFGANGGRDKRLREEKQSCCDERTEQHSDLCLSITFERGTVQQTQAREEERDLPLRLDQVATTESYPFSWYLQKPTDLRNGALSSPLAQRRFLLYRKGFACC